MKKTNTVRAFLVMGLMAWGTSSFAHDVEELFVHDKKALICSKDYWQIVAAEEAKELGDRMNEICHGFQKVIHVAFEHAPASFLKEVLKTEGLPLSSANHIYYTPLMYALMRGFEEIAKVILVEKELASDVINVQSYSKRTSALRMAVLFGFEEIVELLIGKGANIHTTYSDGKTVLEVAKEREYDNIVEMLKEHGTK